MFRTIIRRALTALLSATLAVALLVGLAHVPGVDAGSSGPFKLLIGQAIPAGLGAISQIQGPSDQNLKVACAASRELRLAGASENAIHLEAAGNIQVFTGSNDKVHLAQATAQWAWSDAGLARSAAGILKATDGSTGYGSLRAEWPRRVFSSHKTPGTAATLTANGGCPTHTLTGTAANLSDSTGAYVQLTASGAATGGVDIATTEVVKTEIGPVFTAVVKTGANLPIATERIWVGLASASLAAADSPTGAHVAAFRYAPSADATAFWRFVTNDGGADTGTETTGTVAIAVSSRYVLTIDATNSASITGYVNGTLIGTHTTNLPTVTQALGANVLVRDTAGGNDKLFSISKIEYQTN